MNGKTAPELPQGWVWTTLGKIATWGSGGTPLKSKYRYYGGDIPWLKIGDLNEGLVFTSEVTITKDGLENSSAKWVEKGSLLVAMYGSIGKLGIAGINLTTNQAIAFTKLDESLLDTKFVFWYIRSIRSELFNQSKGATQKNISQTVLKQINVPLPSLPEQHRIATRIEELFTQLDAGVESLKKTQAQLKQYRQSVLKSACEGKLVLTEAELARAEGRESEPASVLLERILKERRGNWEEEQIIKFKQKGKIPNDNKWKFKFKPPVTPNIEKLPNIPEGWTWASPNQISSWSDSYSLAIGPFGSNLKVSDYAYQGVPLVFVRNIRSGVFLDEKTKYVSDDKAEKLRPHWISSGDILITKMGDPPGDSCLYPEGFPKAIITADCIKLRLCQLLDSNKYIVSAIKTQIVRSQINLITKGVAQKKVSLARFKTIGLPIPPLAEQHRIVAEIERRLSVADEIEKTIEQSLKQAERLRQSILKKAFEGKLVPQNPDDEPASLLLERIREEKAKVEAETKKKRKSKAKKNTKEK